METPRSSKAHAGALSNIYEKIARISLYILVFLVPVAYLPWTIDALEVNKQTILLVFTSLAVIAWLGMMVSKKQFFLKKSWIFVLAAAMLVSILVSSFLSLAPFTSWVGQSSQEYTSFLTLLAFVLFFITGAHFLSETKVQRTVWILSFLSSAIIGTFILLAFLGIPILNTTFVGTPNALGMYLATMAVLGSGLWLVTDSADKNSVLPMGIWGIVGRISIIITTVAAITVLLALDYWALWVATLVGLAVIFTFALLRADEFSNPSKFVLPMLIFVISILFLFLPTFLGGKFAVEVAPSFKASLGIAKSSLSDTSWLFGSGPGTYVMDFTQHKPVEINQTSLWDSRFDRSTSHLLTLLPTVGLVGLILFLAFMGTLKAAALKTLIRERVHDEWKMTFVAFAGWSVLAFGMLVYSSNFTLSFMFWLLSAILASQVGAKPKQVAFSSSPRLGLLTTFMFVLVTVGMLTVMFVSVSRYTAEIAFAKAVRADRAGESLDIVIEDLDAAARLNKLSDVYYRNLSHALLLKTGELVNDPEADPNLVQNYVSSSINAARRATDLSPNDVVNWSMLGDIYREVAPLVGNADVFAIASYEKATELSPTNPKYFVSLGQSYIVRSEQLSALTESEDEEFANQAKEAKDEALNKAVEALTKAVELKQDYAPAYYYLAIAYDRQGNITEAVARMETLRNAYPLDVGIAFQLGILYLKQGKTDLAQVEFERAVEISPNFSNALWYLSVVYEEQGNVEGAVAVLERIKELNPENQVVQQRLDRLGAPGSDPFPEPIEEGDSTVTDIPAEEPVITAPEPVEEVIE
jgi:Flp pilus assembly protein TadD